VCYGWCTDRRGYGAGVLIVDGVLRGGEGGWKVAIVYLRGGGGVALYVRVGGGLLIAIVGCVLPSCVKGM
jgi:hypothetical protein